MTDVLIKKSDNVLGDVDIPASKSYANRALVVSAIAEYTSKINNIPHCDDVKYMLSSLENLGIEIAKYNNDIKIVGNSGIFNNIKNSELFCGIAGTTSRFLVALASLCNCDIKVIGEGRILERPIAPLCNALKQIGVNIQYNNDNLAIPVTINGSNINGNKILINGNISSQFISALLMISPYIPGGLEIIVEQNLVSIGYIDITIDVMKKFGINVINENYRKYIIKSQKYQGISYAIEGDWSSASYFFGISTVCNAKINLKNLNHKSIQSDSKIVDIFKKIGLKTDSFDDSISLLGCNKINPIEINMENMPDSAMTIITVLAMANGKSKITGLSTLKNKETDRLLAMHTELAKLGIKTEIDDESITIYGDPNLKLNKIIKINTYHDHRIAMCFAIFGIKFGNIVIENMEVVSKSFPEFWDCIEKIGVCFEKC